MLISAHDNIAVGGKERVQTVLQSEPAECGLACLAMVATALGHGVSLAELRSQHAVSAKGMTLAALMNVADTMGLAARPVRVELEDLAHLRTPAILHWEFNHFVVFEGVRRGRFVIHDPARGKRILQQSEMDRAYTGVAVELAPTPSFELRTAPRRVRLGDMFQRARGLVPSVVQLCVLAAIMQLFALVTPILTQLVVDEAITKGDMDLLAILASGILLLLLITTGVKILQGLVGLHLGTQISFQMRTNLLRHTLRLPVSWFEKRHIGDIVSRFSSLQPVQELLVNSTSAVVLNVLIGTTALVMMLIYSPALAALQVLGVCAFVLIRVISFPYIRRMTDEGLHLDAKVQTAFLETIRGARTFKLFGRERERVAHWQNELARLVNNQIQMGRLHIFGDAGKSIFDGAQLLVVWFFGAAMVIRGEISLGMLFAFQAYTTQFGGAAAVLINQTFVFRTLRVHLERLADVIHAEGERGIDVAPRTDCEVGTIALKGVSFRYAEHEPWVLENVDLTIEPGAFLCIRGPSGQGKTTLLKLILGFEDPERGEVLINGVELRRFGVRTFRSQVGAVLQDDQLFVGSVADNISFFDGKSEMERVEGAARAAGIHEEISQLPMGYRTLIGDLGSTLSSGQRQRVLLARALYRRPTVLFLDEGTANLDPQSEALAMKTVASLPITRIVVAHHGGASAGATRFIEVIDRTIREAARDDAPAP